MTCEQYLQTVLKTYRLVTVLSDKNGDRTLRVRHRTLERDVVLHCLSRPVAAYRVLCGLSCRNLPAVYDAVNLEDGTVVWEEWIDGITVAEVMEVGHYRRSGASKVLRAVCDALTVLHAHGLVHRDVKPENVMVEKSGRVVLIDFNVSREVSPYAARDTVVMGTVGYASPEQLGVSQSDARTDIYALGVLLNVMITGKHPSETLAPGRIGRIVRRCTMVNPDDRYPSAEKLRQAL